MTEDALRPTTDPSWVMVAEGYDPLRRSTLGTRFTISNGFLGIRGEREMPRGARSAGPARTYVAGLFDKPGAEGGTAQLVLAPGWLAIDIQLPAGPLAHGPADLSWHRMMLDEKRGVCLTEGRPLRTSGVAVRLHTLRLVSLSDRSIGLQLVQIEIEQGEVEITFDASFEGLEDGLFAERLFQDMGIWRTPHSGERVAMAAAASLHIDGHERQPATLGVLRWSWSWKAYPGQIVLFDRIVAVTRAGLQDADPGMRARQRLDAARRLGWRGVLMAHETAWADRWRASDVEVGGDAAAQRALRFAIYQLNSAANPHDANVSIAARALTGNDYKGHVFWDTEIFLLPFYSLTWPEAARALLMYRHRTLPAARSKAHRVGCRGALYAWESADTGEEETPRQVIAPDRQVVDLLSGEQEQHISADIAYAVWQYWQATDDGEFLCDAGAEIILETGRFWSSRALPEADGLYHIRGVIGPDEYHANVDDNAFTNVMARWNIRRALEVAALLRARWPGRWTSLSAQLQLGEDELADWACVAEKMATGRQPGTHLFEQFAGYFSLAEVDLSHYAGRSVPMDVVLGRERTQRSQVVKQADVVALLALLPEEFAGEAAALNFRYYEPRCGHGSSLSPAMHGLVAARLGQSEKALRYFRQTAGIDLADSHVAIDGGVHIGALGGVWLTAVFGFAGLSLRSDGLALNPKLPHDWRSMSFRVQWHSHCLRIKIIRAPLLVEATLETGDAMKLVVNGQSYDLGRGATVEVVSAAL